MLGVPEPATPPIRLISGGQTGADRAALDLALEFGLPSDGWCPRGRLAEDGRIGARYPLRETESADSAARTERNLLAADATLIFTTAGPPLAGGTALTAELAARHGKPCLVVSGTEDPAAAASLVRAFLAEHAVRTLNVAGPRASGEPEVGELVRRTLIAALGLKEQVQWSLWLLPAEPAATRLRQFIAELAEANPPAIPFDPHLTLASFPKGVSSAAAGAHGSELAQVLETVAVPRITLHGGLAERGARLAKSLTLPFPQDPMLDRLAEGAGAALGLSLGPVLEPHLSLAYGEVGALPLALPDAPIHFDRLCLARTSRPFHRPGQVAGWRMFWAS